MKKKKYELSFTIICKDGSHIHETATTYEEDGLVNAENNIAWRYVVADNPKAKYKGAIARFGSGREIDGSKKNNRKPLYVALMNDLHDKGVHVEEAYAKQLRQKYAVNKNNYAEKLAQIVNKFKAEENVNAESAAEAVKEDNEMKYDVNFENGYFSVAQSQTVVNIANEIVEGFDSYRFIDWSRGSDGHDGMESMGESWDNDKESWEDIIFSVNGKQYTLSCHYSEEGNFNYTEINGVMMPELVMQDHINQIKKDPEIIKHYLQYVVEYCSTNKKEKGKMEKEIIKTAVPDMLEAIAAVEEEYPENIVAKQEKVSWKNNKALMKITSDKSFSEKYLYGKVFTILQYNHVDVVLVEGEENIHIVFQDNDVELSNKSAIDFGRAVWSEISEIGLDSSRVKNVRDQLTALFTNNKGKQETTDVHKSETVENKIASVNIKQVNGKQMEEKLRNNPYYQMATGSNGWREQEISIQIETKAGALEIKRKLAWKHGQDGFVSGTIKSLNGITGTWFWNTKKSWHPAIKQCGKVLQYTKERVVDVPLSNAQKNVNALILAMQKALKENGVYCRIVAESAGINAKNPAAGTKVCGMVVAHKRIVTGPVGHEPTESDFWK